MAHRPPGSVLLTPFHMASVYVDVVVASFRSVRRRAQTSSRKHFTDANACISLGCPLRREMVSVLQ